MSLLDMLFSFNYVITNIKKHYVKKIIYKRFIYTITWQLCSLIEVKPLFCNEHQLIVFTLTRIPKASMCN